MLDHACHYTASTGQHEQDHTDHTDHTDQKYINPSISALKHVDHELRI